MNMARHIQCVNVIVKWCHTRICSTHWNAAEWNNCHGCSIWIWTSTHNNIHIGLLKSTYAETLHGRASLVLKCHFCHFGWIFSNFCSPGMIFYDFYQWENTLTHTVRPRFVPMTEKENYYCITMGLIHWFVCNEVNIYDTHK